MPRPPGRVPRRWFFAAAPARPGGTGYRSLAARTRTGRRPLGTEDGQAAVELVALLPVLALLALGAWQAVLAGQAAWLAAGAARASARAAAIGDDPVAAARRALPPSLEHGLRVITARSGTAVTVRIGVPSVVSGRRLVTLRASAAFPEQRS